MHLMYINSTYTHMYILTKAGIGEGEATVKDLGVDDLRYSAACFMTAASCDPMLDRSVANRETSDWFTVSSAGL